MPQKDPPMSEGRVKLVLSGDTVVIQSLNNPSLERKLTMAHCYAPRMSREGDEPWAFAARDWLRRTLVGRYVKFAILAEYEKISFGIMELPDGARFPEVALSSGWARLRDEDNVTADREDPEWFGKLKAYALRGMTRDRGMFTKNIGPRIKTSYELPDPKSFVDEHREKDVQAIVERILTGDRLIVRLMPTPTNHIQTILLIAGIRAPATKRTVEFKEVPAEPCGEEAKAFVEERLLQRDVLVTPLGVSPNNQLIGNVKHYVHGSIAPPLLKAGMGRCFDQHVTLVGSGMKALRQAEQEAQQKKLGIHKGRTTAAPVNKNVLDAIVGRIQSADTLILRSKAGQEKRVSLASIRGPKNSDPKQAPWQFEAKEFLRKRLIGKQVQWWLNGKRPGTEGYEEKELATVLISGNNVALALVENGYASVLRHRADDTDRSPIYDTLLVAESKAQADLKGIWSDKGPAQKQFVDYSESLEKARRQLAALQRAKRVPAIVDFVKSASRFAVLVPRENAKLTLVLSGIRAPRTARNANEKDEPFGKEALDFANKRSLQRDVEIDVDDIDKHGAFIGTLYVNRENFAKLLVEEGLASVHAYSAEKSGKANELYSAEDRAKEAKKGMWQNWDEAKEKEAEDELGLAESTHDLPENGTKYESIPVEDKDYRDVIVTHIAADCRIKFRYLNTPDARRLDEITERYKTMHSGVQTYLPQPPKVGDILACRFSGDQAWYRGRIRRNDRERQKVEVYYVDFGNSEVIDWHDLRILGDANWHTSVLPPQAVDAALSWCVFPKGMTGHMGDAHHFLRDVLEGRNLVASVEAQEKDGKDTTLWVTLFDPSVSERLVSSVNAEIIHEGHARLPSKLRKWELQQPKALADMREKEAEAKEDRMGMWEYGDIYGDEEEVQQQQQQ